MGRRVGRGVRGGESSRRLSEVLGLGCPERVSVDWLRFDIHGACFVRIEHRLGKWSRISGTIERAAYGRVPEKFVDLLQYEYTEPNDLRRLRNGILSIAPQRIFLL